MGSDREPWAAWLADHGAAMVLFARSFKSSAADAEDVVQEAFVRFWKARDRVSDPVAFLYRCVRHCALDYRRGQSRQRRREVAAARPEAESWFSGAIEAEERRAAVQVALESLPESQREVLVLRLWGGLTFPQIAVTLETSVNTVTSRHRYALEKLRASGGGIDPMNDDFDPLERELAALQPRAFSPELRQAVAGRLASLPSRNRRRHQRVLLAGAAVAACLALSIGIWLSIRRLGNESGPLALPEPVRQQPPPETWRDYQQALIASERLDEVIDAAPVAGQKNQETVAAFGR